jgi:serine protease Do
MQTNDTPNTPPTPEGDTLPPTVAVPPLHTVSSKRARPVVPRMVRPALRSVWAIKAGALVALCFVAAFGGSAAFAALNGSLGGTKVTTQQSREIVLQEGEVVAEVAKSVSPSVVSIVANIQTEQGGFFGTSAEQEGAGTGIIISKDGYVVTNKHVVPDGTSQVAVVASDGTRYENVTVVGRDPLNDLAFLKIAGVRDLPVAALGDSSAMTVGQKVVAIGNALGQYQTTVTSGIISGTGRPVTAGSEGTSQTEQLDNLLQTDAAINPGNSGGPLVNLKGEVIGINVAVAQDAQGIGFAIPINDAQKLIKSVLATGKVQRGYLGVRYISLSADSAEQLKVATKDGAYISTDGTGGVMDGGPADKAGLRPGDIITKVDGTDVGQSKTLGSLMAKYGVGDTVTLTVLRDGKTQEFKVTLEAYRQ